MNKQEKLTVLAIFGFALLLRLLVIIPSEEIPSYDASGYDNKAVSILEGQGYVMEGRLTSFKPPLYSFFLASIYFLFGHNYLAVRVIQSIIGAITCVIIYFIAKEVFDTRVGVISALIASLYITFIKSTEHLLTECLFTFFISLTMLVLSRLRKEPTFRKQIFIGFILGFSVLTRSVALFFPLFLFLFIFLDMNFKSFGLKKSLTVFAVILLTFILTIAPWVIRNWKVHNSFVLISTAGGRAFYASYCPPEGKLFGLNPDDGVAAAANQINSEVSRDKFFYKETIRYIRNNLNRLPKLELLKILFFWSPFDWELISNKGLGVYNLMYGFILPFFVLGMFFLFKRRRETLVLYLPVIYFQITALIFYGSPRFRMSIEPFLIIFAAFGIMYFFRRFANKFMPILTLITLFIFNLILYLQSDLVKEGTKRVFELMGLW